MKARRNKARFGSETDIADARIIERVKQAHGDRPRIPWSEVKKELGRDGKEGGPMADFIIWKTGNQETNASGSPLFSVESELRQTEFAGGEVEHGHEVGG